MEFLSSPIFWGFAGVFYGMWVGFRTYDKQIAALRAQVNHLQAIIDQRSMEGRRF